MCGHKPYIITKNIPDFGVLIFSIEKTLDEKFVVMVDSPVNSVSEKLRWHGIGFIGQPSNWKCFPYPDEIESEKLCDRVLKECFCEGKEFFIGVVDKIIENNFK